MKRRTFLEAFFSTSAIAFGSSLVLLNLKPRATLPTLNEITDNGSRISDSIESAVIIQTKTDAGRIKQVIFEPIEITAKNRIKLPWQKPALNLAAMSEKEVIKYLQKIRNFDAVYASDIYIAKNKIKILHLTYAHLTKVQHFIGHGNFNLLGFEEMLKITKRYPAIGEFSPQGLAFLEEIFFTDPNQYGFFGSKIISDITAIIPRSSVIKIPRSGHFLLKGKSYNLYQEIKNDVGEQLLLTSGVRNIVKQMHLFLGKTIQSEGNLSKASRSLAPPGHSYHGVGDFDVGRIGFGRKNFTADFSRTKEYRRMLNLGYINIRYTTHNRYGVRFEPWHIKIG